MPDDLTEKVRLLFTKAFASADQRGSEAAEAFTQCFVQDAQLRTAAGTFSGQKEILQSRQSSWNGIESRKHTLKQLYKNTNGANEFLVLGNLELAKVNGHVTDSRFCANASVEQNEDGMVRFVSYEAFAESPPPAAATAAAKSQD
ncbi:hypothetical protein LTR64_002279 [Lithohypha guttulata]|uniref:uncharacterized protein n=1 Tax=Lithohypha guttulata TaxID=1690604 RepID=UPI002DDE3197|nr:hypothetical protein LTR51_001494 [Lithohypha guttulata]